MEQSQQDDQSYKVEKVWYAMRTFNNREMAIDQFLNEHRIPHFIPMVYKEKLYAGDEKPKRVLVPVVHNLVFIQKTMHELQLKDLLKECETPHQILHKIDSAEWSEISDQEMTEFRIICDPNYDAAQYISIEQAEAKIGKTVRVIHGPYAGIEGKMVRFGNKYFVIKTLAGIGVKLHISRWYCKILE